MRFELSDLLQYTIIISPLLHELAAHEIQYPLAAINTRSVQKILAHVIIINMQLRRSLTTNLISIIILLPIVLFDVRGVVIEALQDVVNHHEGLNRPVDHVDVVPRHAAQDGEAPLQATEGVLYEDTQRREATVEAPTKTGFVRICGEVVVVERPDSVLRQRISYAVR